MGAAYGILLAGGQGRRLGQGRPKALATVGGITLLERALGTLAKVCEEVLVVAPEQVTLPLPPGTRRLLDPGVGPLGGIAAAGSALAGDFGLVLGVDYPFVRRGMLAYLLERIPPKDAVVPLARRHWHPLVAAYSTRAIAEMAEAFARGERSLTRAVLPLLTPVLEQEVRMLPGGLWNLFDVDSPEDLQVAERLLAKRAARGAEPGRRES